MSDERNYRAYVVGSSGRILGRHELFCADDEAAKARAKALVDYYMVELWEGSRQVAVFRPEK